MSAIILFRSLTYAQRGVRILGASGIPANVVKAPAGISDRGCVYAAGVSQRNLRQALHILSAQEVSHGGVFLHDGKGNYTEVSK